MLPESDDPKGSTETEEKTETSETGQNSEESNEGQSNSDQKETPETALYQLPDGSMVDEKTALSKFKSDFWPEFNLRSQELAELKRQQKEAGNTAATEAREQVGKSELLKNVPPDVKEAIVQIVTPLIQDSFKQREEIAAQDESRRKFKAESESLKVEFPGKNGLPKFDENEVLAAMRDPSNRIYDQRAKFHQMHEKEFMDVAIKEALKKQSGGNYTEQTGSSADHKPDKKSPKTFDEASKAFLERLSNQ